MSALRNVLTKGLDALGFELSRKVDKTLSPETREVIDAVGPYTMTSEHRISAVCDAVRYIEKRKLPGAFVECGVWRGGSSMAMAYTLQSLGSNERDIFLYDTYEGMSEPTEFDRERVRGRSAATLLSSFEKDHPIWAFAAIDDVKHNLARTGYPLERLHFVKGKVEETIPSTAPEQISLLRLDTDWYESTRHELECLYPRLVRGGVLILDDYGHWDGARKAVDEYFASIDRPLMLHRIDFTGRSAVKD